MDARRHASSRRQRIELLSLCAVVVLSGCAPGSGPRLFPREPSEIRELTDGATQRWYATTAGARPDYFEEVSPQGRVVAIGYSRGEGGEPQIIQLDEVPPTEYRHLV